MKQKKAAIELSIGTVVIIVLSMTMLILGLILVRSIFTGATDSVDTLNEKVKSEITSLFASEGTKIAIKLGSDKTVKIEQGTSDFGVGVGALTREGENAEQDNVVNLQYFLELLPTDDPCDDREFSFIRDHVFNKRSGLETPLYDFEDTEGPRGFVRLVFDIPDGTPECSQRIKIHTVDRESQEIASATFRVNVVTGGVFS